MFSISIYCNLAIKKEKDEDYSSSRRRVNEVTFF